MPNLSLERTGTQECAPRESGAKSKPGMMMGMGPEHVG